MAEASEVPIMPPGLAFEPMSNLERCVVLCLVCGVGRGRVETKILLLLCPLVSRVPD